MNLTRLLLNFYRNNGFFNAEVKNSFVEFENAESFKLTFNINPGKLFQFNDQINIYFVEIILNSVEINFDSQNFKM